MLNTCKTRCLYCVECPQYSTRLEALAYLCDCLSGQCPNITTGQSNLTRRIAAVDGWLNVIRQVTATCPPMRAHWHHLANTIELVHPSAHSSPQPKRQMLKWIGSAVFAQLTAESAYTLQWAPISTRIAPSHGGSGHPM